jgi:hypothetical protein
MKFRRGSALPVAGRHQATTAGSLIARGGGKFDVLSRTSKRRRRWRRYVDYNDSDIVLAATFHGGSEVKEKKK